MLFIEGMHGSIDCFSTVPKLLRGCMAVSIVSVQFRSYLGMQGSIDCFSTVSKLLRDAGQYRLFQYSSEVIEGCRAVSIVSVQFRSYLGMQGSIDCFSTVSKLLRAAGQYRLFHYSSEVIEGCRVVSIVSIQLRWYWRDAWQYRLFQYSSEVIEEMHGSIDCFITVPKLLRGCMAAVSIVSIQLRCYWRDAGQYRLFQYSSEVIEGDAWQYRLFQYSFEVIEGIHGSINCFSRVTKLLRGSMAVSIMPVQFLSYWGYPWYYGAFLYGFENSVQ
jgi:hypothetical protein